MRARLTKDFRFEAAHTLPSLPDDHKCRQMHGHSFKIEISIEGEVDETISWVYDHKRISDAMRPLVELLDHGYLNDVEGLESPTIERMAAMVTSGDGAGTDSPRPTSPWSVSISTTMPVMPSRWPCDQRSGSR